MPCDLSGVLSSVDLAKAEASATRPPQQRQSHCRCEGWKSEALSFRAKIGSLPVVSLSNHRSVEVSESKDLIVNPCHLISCFLIPPFSLRRHDNAKRCRAGLAPPNPYCLAPKPASGSPYLARRFTAGCLAGKTFINIKNAIYPTLGFVILIHHKEVIGEFIGR